MSRCGRTHEAPQSPEMEKMMGARDPTAGELGSNFATKVQGHADTEHVIKVPDVNDIVGLKKKKCIPCEGKNVKKMSEEDARMMLKQAGTGWKIEENDKGELMIKMEITVKSFNKGLELFKRVGEVADAEGHHPDLHLEGWNKVSIVLNTHSVGGLTENDFIMAAKINDIDVADLKKKPKQKFWA